MQYENFNCHKTTLTSTHPFLHIPLKLCFQTFRVSLFRILDSLYMFRIFRNEFYEAMQKLLKICGSFGKRLKATNLMKGKFNNQIVNNQLFFNRFIGLLHILESKYELCVAFGNRHNRNAHGQMIILSTSQHIYFNKEKKQNLYIFHLTYAYVIMQSNVIR